MPEAPAATSVLSTTSTSSPCSARCQAVDRPWTPAPMTRCFTERIGSVQRRFPALEHRRPPVLPDGPGSLDPWPQLRLRELAVLLLQPDAVGVARLEVLDQHLARDLVLPPLGDREVDLQERVRVAVEDGRDSLLLEPVDVLARGGRLEIDVLDQRDVVLIGKALARELLGGDDDVGRQGSTASRSGRWSIGFSR